MVKKALTNNSIKSIPNSYLVTVTPLDSIL